MGLREQFTESLKQAMKAKDQKRVGTLRLMLAALKDRDIANRTEESREGIADDEILTLLAKMVKQREESAETYDRGGRPELAAGERAEIAIIREYMPKQMDAGAAKAAIQAVVMAALKERYAGQMDFARASGLVKDVLSGKA